MDWTANIAVHETASPEFLREQVMAALRQKRLHPHLLYSGLRQASLWTALHHSISPAQRDESCVAIYESAFGRAAENIRGNVAHVVSFACGDGTKDLRCLQQMRARQRAVLYTPVDISLDLVLTASRHAAAGIRGLQCTPLLCDLPRCSVLPAILKGFDPSGAERILLFLGTIHNFWPPDILRSLLYPLRSQDQLLLSANLAPPESYDATLESILGQYDNPPTRAWLLGALSELGLTEADGTLSFVITPSPDPTLKKIEAVFTLTRPRSLSVHSEQFLLQMGDELSVFYSYRFTPAHITRFAQECGLAVLDTWIAANGQEGLFLCRRPPARPRSGREAKGGT